MAWAFKVSIALITKHWRHLNVLNVVAAASVVVVVESVVFCGGTRWNAVWNAVINNLE